MCWPIECSNSLQEEDSLKQRSALKEDRFIQCLNKEYCTGLVVQNNIHTFAVRSEQSTFNTQNLQQFNQVPSQCPLRILAIRSHVHVHASTSMNHHHSV